MTAWFVVVGPLILFSNFFVLAGMVGGRATGLWRRRIVLVTEVALLATGFFIVMVYALFAVHAHTKGEAALAVTSTAGPAVVAGTLLAYAEYSVAGRRGDFVRDLSRALWFGR